MAPHKAALRQLQHLAPGLSPGQLAVRAVTVGAGTLAHHHYRRELTVTDTQKVTLGVIAAYVVIIAILWNVPYVRWSLWPFKMLVIAFHEFSHALAAILTGGKVKSISLDPNEGGVTHMLGGKGGVTLPAGYLGSSLIGALLTFCGFDIVASKVASIVLGVCFLLTLWWARRDWLTIITVLLAIGLIVACWFIAHAAALRFVVLFIGVMSSLYSVWDIVGRSKPSASTARANKQDSATTSFSERSTALTPAYSPTVMAGHRSVGVSSGPSFPSCSWLLVSSLALPPSLNLGMSRRTTPRTSSRPVEPRSRQDRGLS